MALGMALLAVLIMLLLIAFMWYSWYGQEYDSSTIPETTRPENAETEVQYPPYPATIPMGMPAPPEGYLTSTIPVISMNEPRSGSPACAPGFIDSTDLPPSYDEVVRKK